MTQGGGRATPYAGTRSAGPGVLTASTTHEVPVVSCALAFALRCPSGWLPVTGPRDLGVSAVTAVAQAFNPGLLRRGGQA
jgi:hypothetical protein